jgi:hypothetical protein
LAGAGFSSKPSLSHFLPRPMHDCVMTDPDTKRNIIEGIGMYSSLLVYEVSKDDEPKVNLAPFTAQIV